jgi:hypothetical protein
MMNAQKRQKWVSLTGCVLCLAALPGSLRAANAYVVRNLTSDIPDLADHTDPNLKGAWGISESATSPFWISDAATGLSTLYNPPYAQDLIRQPWRERVDRLGTLRILR